MKKICLITLFGVINLCTFFCANSIAQTTILTQNFEGSFPPTGWANINGGSGNSWVSLSSGTAHGGTGAAEYLYNYSNAANAWLISPGVSLTAGTTYTIKYWERTASSYTEKLKVTVGTSQTIAGQTTVLQTLSSLINTSYTEQTITYTPSSSGTYYFAWNCYSASNQYYLDIDDISITSTAAACGNTTAIGTWTGGTSTDWNNTANWGSCTLPTSTTDVTIPSGTTYSPALSATSNCKNLTINSGATLNCNSYTLNVYGNWDNNGTFNPNSGILNFTGTASNQTIDNGSSALYTLNINKASGTVQVTTANLDINGNFTISSGSFDANTYNLNVAGNWSNSGTFIPSTGTVTFDGTGTSTITRVANSNSTIVSDNFESGSTGWNLGSVVGHSEFRRQSSGGGGNSTSNYIGLYDLAGSNGPGYCQTCGNYHINAYRNLDLTDYSSATLSFYWKSKGNGIPGDNEDRGFVLIGSNYLTVGTETELCNQSSWISSGSISLDDYCGADQTLIFRWTQQTTSGVDPGLCFDEVVITGKSNVENFGNVTFAKSSGTVQLLSAISCSADLAINAGATLDANGNNIKLQKDFNNNGTFNANSGTVFINGSAASQTIKGASNTTFYNLEKNTSQTLIIGDATASDKTIEASNSFTWTDNNDRLTVGNGQTVTFKIAGDIYINPGCTLTTANASTVSLSGSYTNYGTYLYNNGVIKFHGTGTSFILKEPATTILSEGFESGTTGWTLGDNANAAEWVRSSGSANGGTYDCSVYDNDVLVPFDYYWEPASSGYVDLYKTIDLSSYEVAALTFWWRCSGEAGADYGQVLMDDQVLVDNMFGQVFWKEQKKVDLSSFCGGTHVLKFRFKYNTSGGSAPGLCIDDILISTNAVNEESFYDLTIAKTSPNKTTLLCPVDVNNDIQMNSGVFRAGGNSIKLGGDWTSAATTIFQPDNNTLTIDGSGTQNINIGETSFNNVTINKSAGSAYVSTNTLDIDGNILLTSGTLDANDQDIEIAGNWTNNATFTPQNKTVTFNGTSILSTGGTGAGKTFYSVNANGASSTLAGNIDIDGNFTITMGTWDVSASNYSMNVAGNWLNSGTFNKRSGTVTFDGSSNSNVTGPISGGSSSTPINEDFDPNPGTWTSAAISGVLSWTIGDPQGGNGDTGYGDADPSLDHSTTGNDRVAGQGLGTGTSGGYNNNTNEYIKTPAINCASLANTQLVFWRWANFESDFDTAFVEISTNNTTWTNLNEAQFPQDIAWTQRTIDISQYADGSSTVYIRWRANSDGSVTYSGWNIDDVVVSGTSSGGTQTETFYNLTANKTTNTYSISPSNSAITVSKALTLTSGNINTSSSSLLIINDDATASSGNNNSFVNGPMKKIGNDAFTFPVGDIEGSERVWARLGMSALANYDLSTEFTCEYFFTPYSDIINLDATWASAGGAVSQQEYWNITRTTDPGNNAACKITLYWENAARSGIAALSDIVVGHYTGGQWIKQDGGTPGTGTVGVGGTGSITGSLQSTFSPETYGTKSGSNSLPTELLSFNVQCASEGVVVNWTTASETNNDFFTIEKSYDGLNFSPISKVNGAGNSNSLLTYSYTDISAYNENSYYRLKQTDMNGQFVEYNPQSIICNSNNIEFDIVNISNDQNTDQVALLYNYPLNGKNIYLKIYDANAQLLLSENLISNSGFNQFNISSSIFSAGVYMFVLSDGQQNITRKLLIN
ncbi:MAG: choice-of-anchor J domain-containing protein [Bacteroidota bacterium]